MFLRLQKHIFQYEQEEMCGHHFTDFLDNSSIPEAIQAFRESIEHGTHTKKLTLRIKRKDGSLIWGELNGTMMQHGNTSGTMVVIRDTNERVLAEESIRESENKYRTLFENMRQGVFFQRKTGEMFDVNDAAMEIFGLSKDQILGTTSFDAQFEVFDSYGNPLPPENRPSTVALATGEPVKDVTLAFRNLKDNTLRWLIINAIPQFLSGETQPYQVFVTMHDITERRQAEETLAQEAVRRKILIDQSRDGIVLLDCCGKVYESNQQFARMLGYTFEEVQELHVWDWDDQWSYEELQEMIRTVDETGALFETHHRRKNGTILDIEISANGTIFGGQKLIFCVCRDISERKRAENALRESETIHRTLVNCLPDIVMRFDSVGRHLFVSENVTEIAELHASDFIGKTHRELGFPESYSTLWEEALQSVVDTKISYESEFSIKGKHGKKVFNWRLVPEIDAQGNVKSVLSISRDITAHRQAEQDFQMLFRQMLDGFALHEIICDENDAPMDYRFLAVNPAFEQMTGLHADQIVGFTAREVIPNLEPYWIETYGNVALSGKPTYFENFSSRLNKFFKVTAFQPAANQFACIFSDVTDRKQAERELKESEERYRAYISNIHDVIAILDANLVIKYKSPNITHHFGWLPEELIGRDGWETIHPDDREYIASELFALLEQEGNTGTAQYRHLCKDGSYKYIELYAVNMINDPVIQGILANYHDVTDQRRNAEIIRENEEKFRLAFKTSPDAVNINSLDGAYIEINDGFTRETGYTEEEVLGKTSTELNIWVNEEERDMLVEELKKHGSVTNFQVDFRCRDGSIKTSIMSASIINIHNEPCILSITRDITERIRLEEQLLQAQKMEAVGRLAGGVAHDFNNMLSIIIGNTELALESITTDNPIHDNLDDILKATERSAGLTRQLLAFARKQTVSPKVLDLNVTVGEHVQDAPAFDRRRDIKLTWIPGIETWPVKIDPSQVDQILANLCVNARDAISDVGRITIETANVVIDEAFCKRHKGFKAGEFVLLAVSDDGCGMDRNTLTNLFEPFFTTKEMGKGTGLGLATVYGIVKQNNGFISVYSEPGIGTTFKIYLPRHEIQHDPSTTSASGRLSLLGNETILLVEDELAILHMTKTMLEHQGYTVLAANAPEEAIRLAREYTGDIHLLITDVIMPGMNGRDLVRNLLPLYPEIERLFMSGYTANVIAHHGVLDEGVNFIQKPFTIKEISAKVREALD